MPLSFLSRFLARDLAIDLGTANTLVYARGEGIILNEPSIVALRTADGTVIAAGQEAKMMLGRTPASVAAIRPIKDGVIADLEVAHKMLHAFIARAHGRQATWLRPRIVIGVPSGITQVEQRAVRDTAMQAGAREVFLVQEPTAAAIGAGLPIDEPGGNMILTIGGGTTEVAVLSLSGVVYCESLRTAGDELDDAIIAYIKKHHSLMIGERQAETIKIELGSACDLGDGSRKMVVKGRDLVGGIPKTITVTSEEIREAIREAVMSIAETVHSALERTPPELAADIVDKGIVVTGGGALLRGFDELLRRETNLPVTIADDPLTCAARGAGRLLDDMRLLRKVAVI